MPNNLSIKDAYRVTQIVKTTETDGVHTPHNIVKTEDGSPLDVSITGLQNGALAVTSSAENPLYVSGDIEVTFDTSDELSVKPTSDAVFTVTSSVENPIVISGSASVSPADDAVFTVTSSVENPLAISGSASVSPADDAVFTVTLDSTADQLVKVAPQDSSVFTVTLDSTSDQSVKIANDEPISVTLGTESINVALDTNATITVKNTVEDDLFIKTKKPENATISTFDDVQVVLSLCAADPERKNVIVHNSSTQTLYISLMSGPNPFGTITENSSGNKNPEKWSFAIFENGIYQSEEMLAVLPHYGFYRTTEDAGVVVTLVT